MVIDFLKQSPRNATSIKLLSLPFVISSQTIAFI